MSDISTKSMILHWISTLSRFRPLCENRAIFPKWRFFLIFPTTCRQTCQCVQIVEKVKLLDQSVGNDVDFDDRIYVWSAIRTGLIARTRGSHMVSLHFLVLCVSVVHAGQFNTKPRPADGHRVWDECGSHERGVGGNEPELEESREICPCSRLQSLN